MCCSTGTKKSSGKRKNKPDHNLQSPIGYKVTKSGKIKPIYK